MYKPTYYVLHHVITMDKIILNQYNNKQHNYIVTIPTKKQYKETAVSLLQYYLI